MAIYIGRGANDMKGGVACFISAISTFLSKNKKFKGSISIIIAADEETTGLGTPAVMKYLEKEMKKLIFLLLENLHQINQLG